MRNLKSIILVISILFISNNCGKSIEDSKDKNGIKNDNIKILSKENKTKFSNYKVDEDGNRIPEIKGVTFVGKPFENRDLKADIHLSIPSDNLEFKFTWVVNDKIIRGIESDTLPKEFLKSGDWVFCRAKIINAKKETREVKSKYVRILGTTPILKLDPIPEISIPGEFRYKIKAILPGEESEDPKESIEEDEENSLNDFDEGSGLEFTLLSPTDRDIFLDEKTGEIVWYVTDTLVSSLGNKIEIKFKVSNPEGGSVISSIKLSFKKPESDEVPKIIR